MTRTKAAGALAVLESGFKIITGKEADFLAYQAEVGGTGNRRLMIVGGVSGTGCALPC